MMKQFPVSSAVNDSQLDTPECVQEQSEFISGATCGVLGFSTLSTRHRKPTRRSRRGWGTQCLMRRPKWERARHPPWASRTERSPITSRSFRTTSPPISAWQGFRGLSCPEVFQCARANTVQSYSTVRVGFLNPGLRLIRCGQDAFPVRCDSRMACVQFARLIGRCATPGAFHFQYLGFVAYHE